MQGLFAFMFVNVPYDVQEMSLSPLFLQIPVSFLLSTMLFPPRFFSLSFLQSYQGNLSLYCHDPRKAKVLWQNLGHSTVQSPLTHFSPSLFCR